MCLENHWHGLFLSPKGFKLKSEGEGDEYLVNINSKVNLMITNQIKRKQVMRMEGNSGIKQEKEEANARLIIKSSDACKLMFIVWGTNRVNLKP